jgi:hypothetical protein
MKNEGSIFILRDFYSRPLTSQVIILTNDDLYLWVE